MTPKEIVALLQEFYRDKLALRARHAAGAAYVSDYEFNNTYQYIIAREDAQLAWLQKAIVEMTGEQPDVQPPAPELPKASKKDMQAAVIRDDRDRARAFYERWRDRVESLTHQRHRLMLRVILGETLEHQRFFEQMISGRFDLLGRRPDGASTGGGVLPVRWVE